MGADNLQLIHEFHWAGFNHRRPRNRPLLLAQVSNMHLIDAIRRAHACQKTQKYLEKEHLASHFTNKEKGKIKQVYCQKQMQ